ncbi:MAG: DNA integrity scanning diadenylate cyclase DisA [Candidatus Pacearchaeota archaeon]|nr:DNA integrity scanning diadenylate cyclase DisA [Candidatus Pacearchaeota archaeon]
MEGQKTLIGEKKASYSLAEVLKIVAFGSETREALEKISKSHRGAIIVLSESARNISEGGFNINSNFTAQRMAELAKMDGAIIIDSKMKKILYANTLLAPDLKIKSKETGTKHRAAERTAKQLGVIVLVVSEKSSVISIYYNDKKYILNDLTELLYKAREAIENLERQKSELDLILKRFDSLEVSSLVNIEDLAQIINKLILFFKDAENGLIYVAELGKHGETLRTRFNLATSIFRDELANLKLDYGRYFNMDKVIEMITHLKTPTLEQSMKILSSQAKQEKNNFLPLGYRLLIKMISKDKAELLINNFKDIKGVLYSESEDIAEAGNIEEKLARNIKEFLASRVVGL